MKERVTCKRRECVHSKLKWKCLITRRKDVTIYIHITMRSCNAIESSGMNIMWMKMRIRNALHTGKGTKSKTEWRKWINSDEFGPSLSRENGTWETEMDHFLDICFLLLTTMEFLFPIFWHYLSIITWWLILATLLMPFSSIRFMWRKLGFDCFIIYV